MELEPDNKFTKFKLLFSVEKKELNDYEKMTQEVSSLLRNDMLLIVFEYVHNGYQLTKHQEQYLYNKLEKMFADDRIKLFIACADKNIYLSDSLLLHCFEDFVVIKNQYDRWKREEEDHATRNFFRNSNPRKNLGFEGKKFIENIMQRLPNLNIEVLYNKWNNALEETYKVVQNPIKLRIKVHNHIFIDNIKKDIVKPIRKYADYMLLNKSLEQILESLDKLEVINQKIKKFDRTYYDLNSIIAYLKDIPNKHYQDQIEIKKKQINTMYANKQLDKLVEQETIVFNKNNRVEQLPQLAQDILNKIKNEYLLLNKIIEDLAPSEQYEINNLWTKRVPEVISKYLRADPEFRTTMKDDNHQTIESLMIDSLKNIYEKLKVINNNHNRTVLHEMSALNRYTKTI